MEHAADRQQPTTAQQRWQRRMAAQPVPPAQTRLGLRLPRSIRQRISST